MKKSCLFLTTLLITISAPGFALAAIDFTNWELQEPSGTGNSPTIITGAQMNSGHTDAYFYTAGDGGQVFMDTATGITTSGSVHCRCEMREMSGGAGAAWAPTNTNTMTVTGKVIQLGDGTSGHTTIGQVFNNNLDIPLCEFQYDAGVGGFEVLYEEAKGAGNTVNLHTAYALNTNYTFELSLSNDVLTVTINGVVVFTHTPSAGILTDQFYFKCGNYDQTAVAGAVSTTPYTVVEDYAIDVFHGSGTPTPTKTATTAASTPTATLALTATSTTTNTATKTATLTFTNTVAHTSTPTLTFTNTMANTATLTLTASKTATLTFTNTTVNTATFTNTPTNTLIHTSTFTQTFTNTATNTALNTSTPINTATSTATGLNTATSTLSATHTTTNTSSPTVTSTPTNSPTGTPTATKTSALTNTPVNTATFTFSSTSTPTRTYTNTSTATLSLTFTPTSTPTPTWTNTNTSTATLSFTFTPTSTPTPTWTNTNTNTLTSTPSLTRTPTTTSTVTSTFTVSSTKTFTLTFTYTAVPPTNTPTITSACSGIPNWNGNFVAYSISQKVNYDGEVYQCIQAHTSEPTWEPPVVPALWKDLGPCGSTPTAALVTQSPVAYPNPATSSVVNIQLPMENATSVKIQIMTVAFREVQTITLSQVVGNSVVVSLLDKSGTPLANGLYYFVIQTNGQKWINKVLVLR